jgi:murein L,D-transpeptidase YcbB/YkuD
VGEGDLWREPTADPTSPAAPISAAEVRRAVIERRRLVAGLVFVLVLGVAAAIAVLLLRGGHEAPTTPVAEPTTTTTPGAGESSSSPTPTTPSTSPSTTTPTTTTSPGAASTFTLPEGTKLRLGQGDPAVVKELQQALAAAGYDPGPADGTFGQGTEKAVVAFQQAKGLSPDGVVGPETASALNGAVAGG